ncbi:hypothetical protein ACQ4WX_49245 [Streptomyces lasalocidi]
MGGDTFRSEEFPNRSEELPNFDGTTCAFGTFPGVPLRSRYAPLIDRIPVIPYARQVR